MERDVGIGGPTSYKQRWCSCTITLAQRKLGGADEEEGGRAHSKCGGDAGLPKAKQHRAEVDYLRADLVEKIKGNVINDIPVWEAIVKSGLCAIVFAKTGFLRMS